MPHVVIEEVPDLPRRHHDFVSVQDFPRCWNGLTATVEVEAKEVAVLKLMRQVAARGPEPTGAER